MLLALFLLAAPAPEIAPLTPPPTALTRGTMGLSFGFPNGSSTSVGSSSTVGLTWFIADSTALRLDFGLSAVLSPSGTPALFDIGIAMRLYQFRRNNVALFLQPALMFGREMTTTTDAAEFIELGGGVGAEYFFADHFSIGGVLSLGLAFHNVGGPAGSSVQTSLSTATSGLFASVYF